MARRRRNDARPQAVADPAPQAPSYGDTGPYTSQSPMGTIGTSYDTGPYTSQSPMGTIGTSDGGGGYGTGYAGVDPGWESRSAIGPGGRVRPGTSEPAWGSHLGVNPSVAQGGLGFAQGGPVDSQYADDNSDEDDTVNSGTGAKWTKSAYDASLREQETQGYADGGEVEDESASLDTSSYRDQEAVRLAEVERRQMEEEARRRQEQETYRQNPSTLASGFNAQTSPDVQNPTSEPITGSPQSPSLSEAPSDRRPVQAQSAGTPEYERQLGIQEEAQAQPSMPTRSVLDVLAYAHKKYISGIGDTSGYNAPTGAEMVSPESLTRESGAVPLATGVANRALGQAMQTGDTTGYNASTGAEIRPGIGSWGGLAAYARGDHAVPPEQLDAHLQQTAAANPGANPAEVAVKAVTDEKLDPDQQAGLLGGMSQRYQSINAMAQGALAHGDVASAARLAQEAHNHVPDGQNLNFRVEGDRVIATVDPLGKAPPVDYPMTLEQFHHYLVGPATSFDHVVVNGVAKNLQIASGVQGIQSQAATGFNAGNVTATAPATATAEAGAPPNVPLPMARPAAAGAGAGAAPIDVLRGTRRGTQMVDPPDRPDRLKVPGEDMNEGMISIPRGVAPGTKDITMYTADGQEIPMRVPSYWDPSKIRYEHPTGPQSGRPVFQHPPAGQASIAPKAATAGGDETGTPAYSGRPQPTIQGGTAFGSEPTIGGRGWGPNETGVPPPLSDQSPMARAQRQFPASSQAKERNAAQSAYEEQASKERVGESAAQTRADIAELRARTSTGNVQAQIAGRKDVAAGHDAVKLQTHAEWAQVKADQLDFAKSKLATDTAQKMLTSRENQANRTYDTKLATGQKITPEEEEAHNKLYAAVNAAGYKTPPVTLGPPPAAAPAAAPAGQAPAPTHAATGAAASQAASRAASGQATATPGVTPAAAAPAAQTTPPGPPQSGYKWQNNPSTGAWRQVPI